MKLVLFSCEEQEKRFVLITDECFVISPGINYLLDTMVTIITISIMRLSNELVMRTIFKMFKLNSLTFVFIYMSFIRIIIMVTSLFFYA